MPVETQPDATVTLKLGGKTFSCNSGSLGKKCGSKEFCIAGTQTDWGGRDLPVYRCLTCKNLVSDINMEPLLPPRNDWRTPQVLWERLHLEYHFNLDAAASPANTKLPYFYDGATPERDALLQNWNIGSAARVWVNPPYQPKGSVEMWLKKGLEQAALGVHSVFLVPMASSVAWFNDLVVPFAEWHTFRGRIAFSDPLAQRENPKQDNLLVIYRPDSLVIGHAAVRDSKTGVRLWSRPDLFQ